VRAQKVTAVLLSLIGISLLLTFNNCSRVNYGLVGGSPLDQLQSQSVFVGNPLTASAKLFLSEVCSVITRCHPEVSADECQSGVLATNGINYQLGLNVGSVSNFNNIINLESFGGITANSTASQTCDSDIKSLSCTDPAVQSAYDLNSSTPFANVPLMIPTTLGSCPAVFSQPVAQKEYFVATNGDDAGDGSSSKPWATIGHASVALTFGSAGAVVHVAPGTYSFPLISTCPGGMGPCSILTTRSGTAAAPLTYISDQQWGSKIAPSGASTIWYNSGDYVKIVGFEVAGTSETNWGIYDDGSYEQVIGNHVHTIPNGKGCTQAMTGGGIIFGYYSTSHNNDAIGNLVHDIGPMPGNGLAETSYCLGSDGISYRQPGGKIYNNIIYKVGSWGIDTYVNASSLQISNNLLFNNGAKASTGKVFGGGILISAQAGQGTIKDTSVSNNIVRNNSGSGITEWDSVGTGNVYFSNLLYQNGLNSYFVSGAPVGTITVDPQMIDFRLDGTGNYRLQSLSPLINAGSDNCAVVTGNGNCSPTDDFSGFSRSVDGHIDLGPFEWHP
jgi:hypothetical protein